MDVVTLENYQLFLSSIAALLTAVLGLFKYFNYRSRRDKLAAVSAAFKSVVDALASDEEVERLSGAVLLRRFFDERTELGTEGTPFAQEAVHVIAAILRSQKTGNFQKLLADGLAFAPTLIRADLQKTNLQYAYLGSRKVPNVRSRWIPQNLDGSERVRTVDVDLSHADFYRADLSGASLKGATAQHAVFYQARLHGTVLKNADLQHANFYEADLKGASFAGARLEGASFANAINLPPGIADHLSEDGVYQSTDAFRPPTETAVHPSHAVFVSRPSSMAHEQEQLVSAILDLVRAEGMIVQRLERPDYPHVNAIGEVRRIMSGCVGTIIVGAEQLTVYDGLERPGTPHGTPVKNIHLPTAWNQIEGGMAAAMSLPILVVRQHDIRGGLFDEAAIGHQLHQVILEDGVDSAEFQNTFSSWCADVRERSRMT